MFTYLQIQFFNKKRLQSVAFNGSIMYVIRFQHQNGFDPIIGGLIFEN